MQTITRDVILKAITQFAMSWAAEPLMQDHMRGATTFAGLLLIKSGTTMTEARAMVDGAIKAALVDAIDELAAVKAGNTGN